MANDIRTTAAYTGAVTSADNKTLEEWLDAMRAGVKRASRTKRAQLRQRRNEIAAELEKRKDAAAPAETGTPDAAPSVQAATEPASAPTATQAETA